MMFSVPTSSRQRFEMQLLCVRNIKWSKSAALVPLLTLSMAYILVLGSASPLIVEGPEKHLENDSNPSIRVMSNTSPLKKEETVENLGSGPNSTPGFNTSQLGKEETVENLGGGFNSTPGCHDDLCLTPGCIHTASEVLKNMDPTVDPCENFYRYACGGFLKSTVIPDDKITMDIFTTTADKINQQLRTTIEAKISPDEFKPSRVHKNLYKSCMNTTAIEAKGLQPLYDVLKRFGGWPVLEGNSWNETDFDWMSSVYKNRDIGFDFNTLITVSVGENPKNSTQRVIELSQSSLRVSRNYLLKGFNYQKVAAYYNYMVDIAVMLGAPRKRAMEELKESLSFEMKLANISLPREAMDNLTQVWNPMTLEELAKNYPSIPWKEFYTKIFPSSVVIEDNEITNVLVPSYVGAFEKLIFQTPKRVQANYVLWNVVADSVRYLNNKIRERGSAYSYTIFGRSQRPSRWKECFQVSKGLFLHATYARKYFDKDSKKNAVEMVMNIREQLQGMIKEADSMDEETRKTAIEKCGAMAVYIGYPDELLNDDKVKKSYENIEFSEDNYFENMLARSRFIADDVLKKLHEPRNKTDWENHAVTATVNAYYDFYENSILFPAGILQGAFFSNDRPKYMNYGAIGSIIGHEMVHAFDRRGSKYDKNGNLFDWWKPLTKENYINRTSCIIEQYSNYTVEEVQLNMNGILTLDENIADLGGLKAAYRAYNNWAAKNGPEKKLPGINRTPQQMFWISSANTYCAKNTPQYLERRVNGGSHSIEEFRIVGTMSDMPEFSEDFHCPLGSKMNPVKKCHIW